MTESTATVATRKVVHIHFTLKNAQGEVIDSSQNSGPLPYLHGAHNLVPGLERELEGRSVGDQFRVTISPEEGYGAHNGQAPEGVPREQFEGLDEILPGMMFEARTADGQPFPVWVAQVTDDLIFVDANHPLAGETLDFSVEVVSVRDATAEEIEHGHVHLEGDPAHA